MEGVPKKFRPNVCVVLGDSALARVLVFRRVEPTVEPHNWQFPQGGLEPGESPEEGMLRELEEEIGTRDVAVLKRAPKPIRYEFPPEILARLAAMDAKKGNYHGQEQHWFLARLRAGTEAIHFDRQPAEFNAFRWVTPPEAVELVVPFKRAAYTEGLRALGWVNLE